MRVCVPPPQTSACSPGSVQPASDGTWGYSFYNSTGPMIPSGLHIYIYAYSHACSHIYIPLLAVWGRAVGQGETEIWATCPLGLWFGLCSVPWFLSLALLPRILQCILSPKVSTRTQHIVGSHQSMLFMSKEGRVFQ